MKIVGPRDEAYSNATPKELKEMAEKGVKVGELNTLDPTARIPTYEVAGNELKIGDEGAGKYINAYITFGKDRPSHIGSGYGGKGGIGCSTIDICAGVASNLRTAASGGKKAYSKSNVVGKIFASDASRIYISQKTDVDANFGLPETFHSSTLGKAAIAVKSDHIRIIGKQSIKLYCGGGSFQKVGLFGESNAQKGRLGAAKSIELIAGDVRFLQPLVKGTNLIKCLNNVYQHIAALYQRDIENNISIMTIRTALIAHFHPSTPVVTFPDPIGAVMHITALPNEITSTINNVMSCFQSELDKAQYLGISPELIGGGVLPELPFTEKKRQKQNSLKGEDYILSSNVFAT